MEENIKIIEKIIEEGNGILRLKPAWVARKHITAGRRFQLDEKDYIVFYESRGGRTVAAKFLQLIFFNRRTGSITWGLHRLLQCSFFL